MIYILFFFDMSFKLTFLKTKCFQKIVENRKTRCLSFSSMFFRGLFYGMKLIFQNCENIGLCTSRCIIIIVVNGQDKSMKPGIGGALIVFLGGVGLEKQLKVDKRGLRGCNKSWRVKCRHTIFCLQSSSYSQYISSSCGE